MKYQLSFPPHIKDRVTTSFLMYAVFVALLPALFVSIYFFKLQAVSVIVVSVVTAVITEALIQFFILRKRITIYDGSALLTGLLLAMTLPATTPWWTVALGSFVAIAIAKQSFGGLGLNIFNPALVGRAFLLASYPVILTKWVSPLSLSAVTTATPLALLNKSGIQLAKSSFSYADCFLGNIPGSLGETSVLALLIGGLFLIITRIIDWKIPFSYIGTVALLMFVFGQDVLFHLLTGGLILGAFFMATDYVTSPMTNWGKIIFGMGAGVIVVVIRLWGGYPEGVCYSILIMNALTPLLDRAVAK